VLSCLPRLLLLASLIRRTVGLTSAGDFLSLQLQNLLGKLNDHCTNALYHSIGSTSTSITSPLDRRAFSLLHRRISSCSVGSTGATESSLLDQRCNYQCTDPLYCETVSLTGPLNVSATCPNHRCDHLIYGLNSIHRI
jgi:hypothetical protein